MSELFFPPRTARTPVADIVACSGAAVAEGADLSAIITGAAAIEDAGPGDLTFFDLSDNVVMLQASRAAACFVSPANAPLVPKPTLALVVDEPYWGFALALRRLFPEVARPKSLFGTSGINPGASIHPEARLEHDVIVDPGVVIGPRVEIGSGTIIGANSVIGFSVCIGRDCLVGPQVTIANALVGDRVTLHPGVRIGQPEVYPNHAGAGQALDRIPGDLGLGRVVIQDGVEIGVNSAVDRGPIGDTVIGEETKIGDLARIAQNVMIGRCCTIPAHAEISKGARLEDYFTVPRSPWSSCRGAG